MLKVRTACSPSTFHSTVVRIVQHSSMTTVLSVADQVATHRTFPFTIGPYADKIATVAACCRSKTTSQIPFQAQISRILRGSTEMITVRTENSVCSCWIVFSTSDWIAASSSDVTSLPLLAPFAMDPNISESLFFTSRGTARGPLRYDALVLCQRILETRDIIFTLNVISVGSQHLLAPRSLKAVLYISYSNRTSFVTWCCWYPYFE